MKWGDLVIVSAPGMTAVSVVIQSDWLEATDSVLVSPKGWNNFSNQFPYHEQHNYQHIGQTVANGHRRFALGRLRFIQRNKVKTLGMDNDQD